jgi:hypothetical protein
VPESTSAQVNRLKGATSQFPLRSCQTGAVSACRSRTGPALLKKAPTSPTITTVGVPQRPRCNGTCFRVDDTQSGRRPRSAMRRSGCAAVLVNESTEYIEAFDRTVPRAGPVRSRHRDRDL